MRIRATRRRFETMTALLYECFPFESVERIGVSSVNIQERAATAVAGMSHPPQIEIRADWYY